ncbi:DNA excision repair protein ERCC-3 [Melghirimyces thermohalophilus]|uniref:DNA 3'-5' helicase n=1 Tax=Melghirimyces thermohalophilus TaxID=1236220 RepID=A0A1G6QH97_9BACL|nr:DNA repair helicase XPB [Melghirimyces thermohalophilus]SDC91057.1 DNA excision repair protein ERCC-3 [Melghirimyces thermohalophilus]
MKFCPDRPMIVQGDGVVLLEADHPAFPEVRDRLSNLAELVKTPDHLHTYRITPLSLWNAVSAGWTVQEAVGFLEEESKFGLPASLKRQVEEKMGRCGLVTLTSKEKQLILSVADAALSQKMRKSRPWRDRMTFLGRGTFAVPSELRGWVKQELIRLGYPVEDRAGYTRGEPLSLQLKETTHLRDYQRRAVENFHRRGDVTGGNGVLVLPCGAGKTVIGLSVMEKVGKATLILTPNTTSVQQWIRELLDKTDLTAEQVGVYTGDKKEVRPVTVATYQILTHRSGKRDPFTHMKLFEERDWGLVIYDEVHLLPAPVFRATADIQARRRLGLTATLVREDGREEDVFSLIGPKKFEVPWKELESRGWIAQAACTEIRTPLKPGLRQQYQRAPKKKKYRIAAENPLKINVLKKILHRHRDHKILVIGQYLDQLRQVATQLSLPLITGQTPQSEREIWFDRFRSGDEPVLVVSKVANFAVDLPDAGVAVQLSGAFGSRQEEAQRLGRILRPKKGENEAHFYHVVSRDTLDQEYALQRQLFLVEQGYRYDVQDFEAWE